MLFTVTANLSKHRSFLSTMGFLATVHYLSTSSKLLVVSGLTSFSFSLLQPTLKQTNTKVMLSILKNTKTASQQAFETKQQWVKNLLLNLF